LLITVGLGSLVWPEEVIAKVEKMSEVAFTETVDIFGEDEEEGPIATVDLLIQFKPKCKNLEYAFFYKKFIYKISLDWRCYFQRR